MKTYRSAQEVLGAVEQVLGPKPRLIPRGHLPVRQIRGARFPESPLVQVAKLLQDARQYFAVTIYLEAGKRVWRAASAPAEAGCGSMRLGEGNVGQAAQTGTAKIVPDVSRDPRYVEVFSETRSELVMPIKIGAHVIGVIDAESNRLNAFGFEERVLLHQVATALAQFLAGPGKYLVMKAREAATANAPVASKQPPAPGEERRRAAAGEKARS